MRTKARTDTSSKSHLLAIPVRESNLLHTELLETGGYGTQSAKRHSHISEAYCVGMKALT